MIVMGIMTGTSVDGVVKNQFFILQKKLRKDVVIVDFKNADSNFEIKTTKVHQFPQVLQDDIKSLIAGERKSCEFISNTEEAYENLLIEIAGEYLPQYEIQLVAIHGQTIYHRPRTSKKPARTWQIGRGRRLASELGIPVACDTFFIQRKTSRRTRGTSYASRGKLDRIFRTGDNYAKYRRTSKFIFLRRVWVNRNFFGLDFDEDGRLAKEGTINDSHLSRLLEDPYFRLPHPKSTGREYFNKMMIKQLLDDVKANKSEKIATITALTTETIIKEVEKIGRSARFLKVFGGGARNTTIMNTLEKRLPHLKVSAAVSSDFREALGFAILGYRRWHRILSVTTTGASGPVLLGELYD
ncbi:Oidioi.mRNA.OKI2018_I69.chr2.g6252.t1.cds [Oikopleura dioica]|uniref:Oidioi.mRNA.OKI2018_I69.chr2.g6252.t1.cds n=1 Tax=Oikopleura dioica TaxID=34765 RepID=A0ABN7T4N6_OIKDI|nr:Oidioi.mRNA.OKI2018_I69.chr2.g6252.t1.cds [Oikopleura dioica]